jgi:formamidopyrimidine-DNA glycosylase
VVAVGGHPIRQDLQKLPNKFSHVIFEFSDGSHLFFNDTRKFGYLKLVDKIGLEEVKKEYGPEPLLNTFCVQVLINLLARRSKLKIKQLLMDQKLIAGIGNIYADESLFCAGIDPRRAAGKIKEHEIKKLHACIKKVLALAVEKRGTSADDYVDVFGRQGNMLPYLKVYGRGGELCRRCGQPIKKIKLNGRGTHFCGKCQR